MARAPKAGQQGAAEPAIAAHEMVYPTEVYSQHREKIRVECLKVAAELRTAVTEPAALLLTAQTLEAWVTGDFQRVPERARDRVKHFFDDEPGDGLDNGGES